MIIPTTESTLRMTLMQLSETRLELAAVTEQRDRLAEAIRKYTSGNYPESFLSKTLQSLNPK